MNPFQLEWGRLLAPQTCGRIGSGRGRSTSRITLTALVSLLALSALPLAPLVIMQFPEPERVLLLAENDVSRPVFHLLDENICTTPRNGLLQGALRFRSFAVVVEQERNLGLRILSGLRLQNLNAQNISLFDKRQLRGRNPLIQVLRFISYATNLQLTTSRNFKYYVPGIIIFTLIETLLILGLLWQRTRRKGVEASLVERLAFERLLSDLSAKLINLPEDQVDSSIEQGLGRIAELLNMDRVTLFEFSPSGKEMKAAFSWVSEGITPAPTLAKSDELPWWRGRLLRGEVTHASDLSALPEEALPEREYFRRMGILSAASVPVRVGGEVNGAISFITVKRRVIWTEGLINQLQILAEILATAQMRKRAQEYRLRHAAIVEYSDDAIISSDLHGIILTWNVSAERLFGFTETEAIGQPITLVVPPELHGEATGILQTLKTGGRIEHYETYRVTKAGKKLDVSLTLSPVRDSAGQVVGISEIARDITHRKLAEKALHELSGHLIAAQEEERARIARELHDDFSQRLALLGIGLDQLSAQMPSSDSKNRAQIHELWNNTKELSSDLHRLSHELHSSKLENVGLVAALMGLCKEITQMHSIQVEYSKHDVPSAIPKEVALCLFRVSQAALGNVVRHSEALRVQVELFSQENQIYLQIDDDGLGFDPSILSAAAGIGLMGMRERLRLVGGRLTVQSAPGKGTRILAEVPLTSLSLGAHATTVHTWR